MHLIARDGIFRVHPKGNYLTEDRAVSTSDGSVFPRILVLRRIPSAAFLLKEYEAGIEVSKTCDREDTLATLGDTPELSVEHSPCDLPCRSSNMTCVRPFSPWCDQLNFFSGKRCQEISKSICFIAECSPYVFPNYVFQSVDAAHALRQAAELECQLTPAVCESLSKTGDGETLARTTTLEHVDRPERFEVVIANLCDVAKIWDAGFRQVGHFPYGLRTGFPLFVADARLIWRRHIARAASPAARMQYVACMRRNLAVCCKCET